MPRPNISKPTKLNRRLPKRRNNFYAPYCHSERIEESLSDSRHKVAEGEFYFLKTLWCFIDNRPRRGRHHNAALKGHGYRPDRLRYDFNGRLGRARQPYRQGFDVGEGLRYIGQTRRLRRDNLQGNRVTTYPHGTSIAAKLSIRLSKRISGRKRRGLFGKRFKLLYSYEDERGAV